MIHYAKLMSDLHKAFYYIRPFYEFQKQQKVSKGTLLKY